MAPARLRMGMARRGRADILLKLVSISVCGFLILSCGLEYYSLLYPPADPSEPTESNLIASFKNDSRNNPDEFEGFEIYYRFYNPEEYASSEPGEQDFELDAEKIEEASEDNVQSVQILLSNRFNRVFSVLEETVEDEPLIAISAGNVDSSFEVQIDFSDVSIIDIESEPVIRWLSKEIVIRRSVVEEGENKKFRPDDILGTDDDIRGIIDFENLGTSLDIVFFAISWGVDSSFRQFYSRPVYLGNFRVDLFE